MEAARKMPEQIVKNDNHELYEIIAGMVADILFDYDITTGNIMFAKSNHGKFDQKLYIPEYSTRISGIVHGEDRGIFERMIKDIRNGKEFFSGECRLLMEEDKEYKWARIQGRTFLTEDGKAYRAVGRVYGIDERKRESLKLYDEAKRDSLTKLFNKTYTQKLIEDYLKQGRYKRGALFIIDVDNFKTVNDTMGHLFGDDTLSQFSKILQFNFRASDIVGRTGGDEFIAFMKNVRDLEIIRNKADAICDAISRIHRGKTPGFRVSGSIGIAVYPDHGVEYEELFRKADMALYKTKENGKNGYTIYNE
jgi:diguanylate cyclase (GGDEF)-like protein